MKEGHEISTRRGDRRATIEGKEQEREQGRTGAAAAVKAEAKAIL